MLVLSTSSADVFPNHRGGGDDAIPVAVDDARNLDKLKLAAKTRKRELIFPMFNRFSLGSRMIAISYCIDVFVHDE